MTHILTILLGDKEDFFMRLVAKGGFWLRFGWRQVDF
jgi:hypothetical protein